MAVRRPTLEQLRSVAEDLGMHMGDEELKSYDALMQANYAAYDLVDAMPDYVPAVTYPRTPGYRPEGDENKHAENIAAWIKRVGEWTTHMTAAPRRCPPRRRFRPASPNWNRSWLRPRKPSPL